MTGKLTLAKLQQDIHSALQTWYEANTDTSPLDHLQWFQQTQAGGATNARQATNTLLLEALELLAIKHKAQADLLRKRFLDGTMMHTVANQLNIGQSTAYRKQQEAIKHLAAIIQEQEMKLRSGYQIELEKRLKLPPAVQLFGITLQLQSLQTAVLSTEPVWVIAIEGLGGIGKTALANALIRQPDLTRRFRNIAWVSAKQHDFLPDVARDQLADPALTNEALTDMLLEQLDPTVSLAQTMPQKYAILTRLLKEQPHVVVIDNLETVVDYQGLLPTLREWANPSKFILTSRHSLRAQPDIFCCSLDELQPADSLAFIRHEAATRGLSLLAKATDAELGRIYEVTGGNPLALKLVVGQLSVLPLSQVLDNLKQARSQKMEAMYTYIYWQSWHMLTANSRQALLVMPLAQDGTLEQLLALSQLDLDDLSQALEQLVALSLVQVGGDLEERRYAVHCLTETFLLQEAIQWQLSL